MSYYSKELNCIKVAKDQPANIVVTAYDGTKTKTLDLNVESAKDLIEWLTANVLTPVKPVAVETKPKARPLYQIASEIKKSWGNVYFGAVPYLSAMSTLHNIKDMYGQDSAKSIVNYFLANAGTWRGETAKRVKAELKAMVK